jgi:hypothetical protein
MNIVISGSREWPEPGEKVYRVLRALRVTAKATHDALHVSHGANPRGVDKYVADWAQVWAEDDAGRNIYTKAFPANWAQHNKSAGPIRNRAMLDWVMEKPQVVLYGRPILIAFPLPESKGTVDCMKAAEERNIRVWDATSQVHPIELLIREEWP